VWGLAGLSFGLQKCYMMRHVGRLVGGVGVSSCREEGSEVVQGSVI